MDLVDFDEGVFRDIVSKFNQFAEPLGFATRVAIPVSARFGDNVCTRSRRTSWYAGSSLLEVLVSTNVDRDDVARPFRMPVQWVNRPHLDFRGLAGTIASGTVRPGDEVVVVASGRTSRVERIVTADGDVPAAMAGDAVTVVLADELDASRGDM